MPGDFDNLEAWAILHGYDPARDYALPPGYLSPHFTEWEFCCHHCGELPAEGIDTDLLVVLEDVRTHFGGKPVTVNSGYRCPDHNASVGGVEDSQHVEGKAADITVADTSPTEVHAYLDSRHEGGLGLYSTFVHIDVRGYRARW